MIDNHAFVERRIVLGMIISTEYMKEVANIYESKYIESPELRMIASWCISYFSKYGEAPKTHIEDLYNSKFGGRDNIKAKDVMELIDSLEDEMERKEFNVPYLIDQTEEYFTIRQLELHNQKIQSALEHGDATLATSIASSYKAPTSIDSNVIDPLHEDSESKWRRAFVNRKKPIITLNGAMHEFLGEQMVRSGFVAFMGPEKVGKSYLLLEFTIRAVASGCNVVLIQAGDMTESDQIRRIGIMLSGKSDLKKYCDIAWIPVVDCRLNQTGECMSTMCPSRHIKVSDILGTNMNDLTLNKLKHAYSRYKNYIPCKGYNCIRKRNAIWIRREKQVEPLTWNGAYENVQRWRINNHNAKLKLITYPNETVTINEIKNKLEIWERNEGFITDVIVLDYADLLASDADIKKLDFRNQENKKWQRLRSLSEEKHVLIITATLSSAKSYGKVLLSRSDFSEDKRKYAHVTAMYGMNQTENEREIGILRLNEILLREGSFSTSNQVTILQRLQRGKPYIGGFI